MNPYANSLSAYVHTSISERIVCCRWTMNEPIWWSAAHLLLSAECAVCFLVFMFQLAGFRSIWRRLPRGFVPQKCRRCPLICSNYVPPLSASGIYWYTGSSHTCLLSKSRAVRVRLGCRSLEARSRERFICFARFFMDVVSYLDILVWSYDVNGK